MSYEDKENIQKRIRQRYAQRFAYLGSLGVFLLFLLMTLSDPNLHGWSGLLAVWPVVHTAYWLYTEFSERAIERAMHEPQNKRKRDDERIWRLTDDGELDSASPTENEPAQVQRRQD